VYDVARKSSLPLYHDAIDWRTFRTRWPAPDVFVDTIYRWSAGEIRELQNQRFLEIVEVGWNNAFYRRLWSAAGVAPGDIRSIDDIGKLPTYTTDDVKDDQAAFPPFGSSAGFASLSEFLQHAPSKVQSSGGTTGKPRFTLHGPMEWETTAISTARGLYMHGVRPGDVMQIPSTCSLANLAWAMYNACHHYLGVLPVTTGSGVVTPSRKQLEIAFDCGTNTWVSFPEYLLRLAAVCTEELGRDVRELKTKLISTFLGADLDESLRRELEAAWGCPVYDNYGTNELGLGATECRHQNGLHLMEDVHFFEILDVESGLPVPDGQAGNLVATSFGRTVQPAIRFNLRDLGRITATNMCECGSNFRRIDHFLGRSDSMVRLRGVNIYPMACLSAVKSDARTTGEWLCDVYSAASDGRVREEMLVHVEVRAGAAREGLREKLEARLRDDLGASVGVLLVDDGALASAGSIGEGNVGRLLDRRTDPPRRA
jgi:phenylacetate-CoA ligase